MKTNDPKTSNVKYTNRYKSEYRLTSQQEEVIIGIILADGHLDIIKSNHNTRLRIEQSYPAKEEYLKSLYQLFEPLTAMDPVILTKNLILGQVIFINLFISEHYVYLV